MGISHLPDIYMNYLRLNANWAVCRHLHYCEFGSVRVKLGGNSRNALKKLKTSNATLAQGIRFGNAALA